MPVNCGVASRSLFQYKYEILLVVVAAALIFSNLGDRTFGGDEGFGMEVVTNILQNNVPAVRSSPGLDYSLVATVNSPVSEYMMAGSVAVLGFDEFSARLPIAIFGVLAVIAIYFFVLNISGSRRTGLIALIFIVFSVVFFLHARQARYYSVALLFNTLFLYAFHRYFISRSGGKWGYALVASAALLFYTHPETAVYTSIAAVMWLIISKKCVKPAQVARVAVPAAILLAPLLYAVATTGTYQITAAGMPPVLQQDFAGIFALYAFTGIYYYLLFFVPLIFLLIAPFALGKFDRRVLLLFLLVVLSHIVVASALSPFGTPSIRKIMVGTLPIDVFLLASSMNFLLGKKPAVRVLAVVLAVILVFTNFAFLFPAALLKGPISGLDTPFIPEETKNAFISKTLEPRFYFLDFLYEITHHYESTIENTLGVVEGASGEKVFYPNGFPITSYMNDRRLSISYDPADAGVAVFDWIILENNTASSDIPSYEKIEYSIPEYDDLWMDTADPVHHRFRSDSAGRVNMTAYRLVRQRQ